MEESISLEETNKIRISLGLKPLTDDGAPADNAEKRAEDNYAKKKEREVKEREAKKIQERITKVRNKHELNASLKGATLGDADGDDGAFSWVKKSKKREKELAKKRQQELAEMDKMFQGDDYSEKDLEGLKVGHDLDELAEGEDRILTLKDSRILDDEEDILQNVEMAEDERTKKRVELKTKKRTYTGYDDHEFEDGAVGMKRSVLAKYDEDISGVPELGFRLGGGNQQTDKAPKQPLADTTTVNKSLLSIDYLKNQEMSDYIQEGDAGFKKPKTKKKRSTRRTNPDNTAEDIASTNNMDVDEPQIPRARNLEDNFVDDDELQAALARTRRAKMKKPLQLNPEEIARRIAEEKAEEEAAAVATAEQPPEDSGTGGLEFDETSEFVRSISFNPIVIKTETLQPKLEASAKESSPDSDEDQAVSEVEAGELVVKEEEDEEAMLNMIENALVAMDEEMKDAVEEEVGTASEQTFSSGMASTLNILKQQGLIAAPTADQQQRELVQKQRDLWLATQRRRIAQKELDRLKSRGSNKDQATREYENRLREQHDARDGLDFFKNYKPDINIVYHDEHGRELTPKEAWKALSHRFHGKGSGKAKIEKRLKKIAMEKKREAMASGDTPLSMNQAFQIRQQMAGQAHMVLSVGNRGAVPQLAEFLDTQQPLSKGKTEKQKAKKKGEKAVNSTSTDATGFAPVLPQPIPPGPSGAVISGAPTTATGTTGSPAPIMKASFARVKSFAPSPSTASPSPAPDSSKAKLAFGFGTKRKAIDEGADGPGNKRR